jgi:hypothetical protein
MEAPLPINAIQAGAMGALPKQCRRLPQATMQFPYSTEAPVTMRVNGDGRVAVVEDATKMMMLPPNPYTEDCFTMKIDKEEYEQVGISLLGFSLEIF